MTTSTVKKYLETLVDRGIVTAEWSLALGVQHISSEKFFTLPNEVFLLRLPPSAFMVYAYLLLIEDRRTHTCHPSYNTIATATGLAKNTAMKSVSTLLEMGLIAVESSSYFDKRGMKWKGNNLYTILPVRAAVDTFHKQQLRQAGQVNGVLPAAIQSAIDGRLGMFEDRLARLFYKLTVEMDMGMSAVLDCIQVDEDYLRKLRANSVKNVKAANGLLTFEQKAEERESSADGDEQWPG